MTRLTKRVERETDFNRACATKHSAYQPTIEEFVCPKCGLAPPDGLCVDSSAALDENSNEVDCNGSHDDDELRCYGCGYATDGRAFARALQKKADLVPCKCCKGKGLVPRKKRAKAEARKAKRMSR